MPLNGAQERSCCIVIKDCQFLFRNFRQDTGVGGILAQRSVCNSLLERLVQDSMNIFDRLILKSN
mgnify:FL=1